MIVIVVYCVIQSYPPNKAIHNPGKEQAASESRPIVPTALIAKAESGDVAAQLELGFRYDNGDWGTRNAIESSKWFRKAADQGNPEAQYQVGLIYSIGETTPQNFSEAFKWFQMAAKQGHTASEFELGQMYDNAQGVNQDYIQASIWYRKAAENGNADAQFLLGILFFNGHGVTQNAKTASEWFTKAANQGEENAQLFLGRLYDISKIFHDKIRNDYFYGTPGFPNDKAEAYKWYNLAAAVGSKTALTNRNDLEVTMAREQVADGQQRASRFILSHPVGFVQKPAFKEVKASAEKGNSDAQFQIGMFYATGDKAPLDYVEAYKWFSLSAAQGRQTAQNSREILLREMTPKEVAEGQSQAAAFKPKE